MKKKMLVLLSMLLILQIACSVQAAENNPNYKDIQINKSNGSYVVTGEAKVRKGVFYYMVENGHNILVPEKKVNVHNLSWTTFKLNILIPVEKLPKNGALILYMYEKDKSSNVTDQHPIVLEKFNG
jgi:hypothetical protein